MMETVMSLTKTTLAENKELTKVVSDAARKQGDIEREKLVHARCSQVGHEGTQLPVCALIVRHDIVLID